MKPTQNEKKVLNVYLYSATCGFASFLATFVTNILHPFQLVKIRFQSHDGKKNSENLVPKYKGVFSALKEIYHTQGFKGLYKGFMISFLSQSFAQSIFFVIYERRLIYYKRDKHNAHMQSVALASIEASVVGTIVTQPLWVIKTRMMLNVDKTITEKQNFKNAVHQIYSQHAVRGYFRGLLLSLLLCSNGFLQMISYEGAKKFYERFHLPQSSLGEKNFICGGLGKVLSIFVTYPLTTIRTRVQQNQFHISDTVPKYLNIVDIIAKTWREERLHGFYKGMWANLLKGIPQRGLYFYCYQLFKTALNVEQLKTN